MKISIYGLGQFGYALLKHFEKNLEGHLLYGFDYREEVVKSFAQSRNHPFLYHSHKTLETTKVTDSTQEILSDADLVILAVPSTSTFDILPLIQTYAKPGVILLNTAKALDFATGKRLSVIYKENLNNLEYKYAFFTGGTIASDLFNEQLLGALIASDDEDVALKIKKIIESDNLRLMTSTDLKGAEYAASFKNVISILTGFAHGKGMSFGSETFLLSKIATEVENLITQELGGKTSTFTIGSQAWGNDMFMSATGNTRNRQFGIYLGKNLSVDEALQQMEKERKTVEGIKTLYAINKLTDIQKYPLLEFLYKKIILKQEIELLSIVNKI